MDTCKICNAPADSGKLMKSFWSFSFGAPKYICPSCGAVYKQEYMAGLIFRIITFLIPILLCPGILKFMAMIVLALILTPLFAKLKYYQLESK